MKKTLVTTAAVLALAGAAAAPASANDCFRGEAPTQSQSSSFAAPASSNQSFTQGAANQGATQSQGLSFQSVDSPQVSTQTVSEAATPVAQTETAQDESQSTGITTQSTSTTSDSATDSSAEAAEDASTTAETTDASSSAFSDQVAQEMLGLINQARAEAGAGPLSTNADLTGIASGWSQQMAAAGAASHSPTFIEQTQATGSSNMAENVAYDVTSGKSAQETAAYFFNFWMNSPGHHANIMNPEFNAIGLSLAEGSNGYVYATQNFGSY